MLQRHVQSQFLSIASGILIAATMAGSAVAQSANTNDPTGDWMVEDGVATVRIQECRGSMWGAVVWEKQPGGTDKNNPDKAKRSRPTLGMALLLDMKSNPKKKNWAGKVYNAKDGKLYDSTIELETPNKLEIEGCVMSILCGSQTWTRVAPPIPSSPSNNAEATPAAPAAKAAPAKSPATAAKPAAKQAPAANAKAAAGSKPATAEAEDPVGDICLLPEIARLAH